MTDAKRRTSVRKIAGSKASRGKTPRNKTGASRSVHDVGGVAALAGSVDRHEHELSLYEKRVDALVMLLGNPERNVFKIDALRRVVESYAAQDYDQIRYYDKWIKAVRDLVIEQEVMTSAELDERMHVVRNQLEAEGRTVSAKPVV